MKRNPKADASLAAVRKLARSVDPEPSHAFQVCKLALDLFDQTEAVHGLGPSERRLLHAAALLHDIGHTIDVIGHHKHARDLIQNYDLAGFSDRERDIVACVARYHRKAHPSPRHRVYGGLNPGDQQTVTRLAAILRIADGLDRGHDAAVQHLRVEQTQGTMVIRTSMRRPSPLDLWGGRRKCGLFEETFGVAVDLAAEDEQKAEAGDE